MPILQFNFFYFPGSCKINFFAKLDGNRTKLVTDKQAKTTNVTYTHYIYKRIYNNLIDYLKLDLKITINANFMAHLKNGCYSYITNMDNIRVKLVRYQY